MSKVTPLCLVVVIAAVVCSLGQPTAATVWALVTATLILNE